MDMDEKPESRPAQLDRQIEDLVKDFIDAPSKSTSDSLFEIMRERATFVPRVKRRNIDRVNWSATPSFRRTAQAG